MPEKESGVLRERGWPRRMAREAYVRLLRILRLVPRSDLTALEQRFSTTLEERLRQERAALQQVLAPWAEKATEAINRMWAWTDNALIVCKKPGGQ